jgi:hypothetical protein
VPEVPFREQRQYKPKDIVGLEGSAISANRSGASQLVVIENKNV